MKYIELTQITQGQPRQILVKTNLVLQVLEYTCNYKTDRAKELLKDVESVVELQLDSLDTPYNSKKTFRRTSRMIYVTDSFNSIKARL